tara:strand:+ start:273 stop:1109 length:837 start_codon:yes stop_codon:yes gene_type:complete
MNKKVSFQGELGSYSHQALIEAIPDGEPLPCLSFKGAIDSVRGGDSTFAVLPVENSTYGRVADIHRLLPDSELFIVKEHFLRVRINLLAKTDVKISEVKSAVSHPVLLGQCKNFLDKHDIKGVVGTDTAGSAQLVSRQNDNTLAALASPLAAQIYNLNSLASGIEDMTNNTTRFLVMSKDHIYPSPSSDLIITSVIFQVRNLPAALYKALGGFATNNVNLLKLESYMLGGSFNTTQFFIDFEGHPDDHGVKLAIEELSFFTSMFKIIGVYPGHKFRIS